MFVLEATELETEPLPDELSDAPTKLAPALVDCVFALFDTELACVPVDMFVSVPFEVPTPTWGAVTP